jgi:putative transposase
MTQRSPFGYFKISPEIIRLAAVLYIRFPLSLRNVEDLLHERWIEISHETVRFWLNWFGPMFASEIRRRRVERMRSVRHRRWHLDEVLVKINGETHYLWLAVDHEGEVLESFVTKRRDKQAALTLKKTLKRHGRTEVIVIDRLRSYGAALRTSASVIGRRPPVGPITGRRIPTHPSKGGSGRCCGSGPFPYRC